MSEQFDVRIRRRLRAVKNVALIVAVGCAVASQASVRPARADAKADRVARAKQLLKDGAKYPKGCSEFVCKVLNVPWEDANSLMGANPTKVGKDNTYTGLTPGDVVGWKKQGGSGHVAIYIGEADMKFIDVKDENEKPRAVKNGYGPQELFKSAKY